MVGVRIPIVDQSVGLTSQGVEGGPNPRMTAVPVSNAMGEALQQFAHAGAQYNRLLEHQADQDARAWVTNALPDVSLKAQSLLQQNKESAKEGAAGFTPGYLEQFDKFAQDSIQNAPTEKAKKYMQEHMASLRSQLGAQAMHFEAGARMAWRAEQVSKGIDSWSAQVAEGKITREQALATINDSMPDVGPEQRQKLMDYADKVFKQASGQRAVAVDPAGTLKAVNELLSVPGRAGAAASSAPSGGSNAIAQAIYGQESGGGKADTSQVNSQNVTGPMQMQQGTFEGMKKLGLIPSDYDWKNPEQNKDAGFKWVDYLSKKYDGDPAKVAAAYYAGEKAVNADGSINRDWKNKQRPGDPTVGQYVDQVIGRMQKQGAKYAAADTGTMTDVAVGSGDTKTTVPPWMAAMNSQELFQLKHHAETQVQHINQQAQTALNLAIQNAEAQAQTGTAPTDQPIGKESFLAAYKDPVAAEAHYARYASARETATAIASMQTQSTAQLVELLDGKKAQKLNGAITDPSDPAFAIKEHNRQIAERAAATIIRQRQADPWAYAIQNRDFAAQIIDPTSPDFGKQLQARSAALPGMMQKYGTGPVLLSDAETKALTNRFAELPADQRVGMLKQIRTSIGDDGAYLQLLNSIRKDSPVTAMVGNIAAIGGTMRVGDADMPLDDVARRIAIGEDLLNKTKKDKGEDGNKGNFQMPKEAQMRQYWVDHVGKAYAGYPDAEAHAYEAFRAYYAARQAEKGVNDPKAGIDDKVAKEAMTAGTGGVTKWGGFWSSTPLVLPYGMSEPTFKDNIAQIWSVVGLQNGYKKTGVGEIGLKSAGRDGEYVVMVGDKPLPGKDGKGIIINARQIPHLVPGEVPK